MVRWPVRLIDGVGPFHPLIVAPFKWELRMKADAVPLREIFEKKTRLEVSLAPQGPTNKDRS